MISDDDGDEVRNSGVQDFITEDFMSREDEGPCNLSVRLHVILWDYSIATAFIHQLLVVFLQYL